MNRLRIAILGATSHIAKSLIVQILESGEPHELYLFARSKEKVVDFLLEHHMDRTDIIICDDFSRLFEHEADLLINSVGVGTARHIGGDYHLYFDVIEEFDNICINYLKKNCDTLYISFSSGAIYGTDFASPVGNNTVRNIDVNHIHYTDYYSIVRLYTEAKHRSLTDLRIIDLRIFNYFSRHINLDDGYFITELMLALKLNKPFLTNRIDIIRDYLHPEDLFQAIQCCYNATARNTAYDIYSSAPVGKFELLDCLKKKFPLTYTVRKDECFDSGTSNKSVYYSKNRDIGHLGYNPHYSSLMTVQKEAEAIVNS
jgi:hypothetical protein